MRILVTGAAGFLGHAVAVTLAREGHSIVSVDRHAITTFPFGRHHVLDLAHPMALEVVDDPIDAVVHLAADVDRCTDWSCLRDNVGATLEVIRWAERHGRPQIVFASTLGVIDADKGGLVDETGPVCPRSIYAMSKWLAECAFQTYEGRSTILRFSYIYGPGDRHSAVARILSDLVSHQAPVVRNEHRDLVCVIDAVSAVIGALQYRGAYTVFHIGTGVGFDMSFVVETAARLIGVDILPEIAGARVNAVGDARRAERELHWAAVTSLEDGLELQLSAMLSELQH